MQENLTKTEEQKAKEEDLKRQFKRVDEQQRRIENDLIWSWTLRCINTGRVGYTTWTHA